MNKKGMNMKEQKINILAIRKQGMFIRLIDFFRKKFSKNEDIPFEPEPVNINDVKSVFKENLKCNNYDFEENLKRKLDRNEIKVSDLTPQEKSKMMDFFKKQIKYKQERFNSISKRILKLKKEVN